METPKGTQESLEEKFNNLKEGQPVKYFSEGKVIEGYFIQSKDPATLTVRLSKAGEPKEGETSIINSQEDINVDFIIPLD